MVVMSLVTALVLNRKIMGRGFWRGVFFYPVLLSPVVVALIWKWILQREGVLNAALAGAGGIGVEWLNSAGVGIPGSIFVSHLGAHGLLHADPARRTAGDPEGPLRGRADGPRVAVAHVFAHHAAAADAEPASSCCVLALIRAVQTFDEVFVLTGGGPGSATTFIVQFIYQTGFMEQIRLYGMAAAASLVLAAALIAADAAAAPRDRRPAGADRE